MIDLFAGLGGWAEGALAEGYDVIGFDVERHRYPKVVRDESAEKLPRNNGGAGSKIWSRRPVRRLKDAVDGLPIVDEWVEYPAQLVLQDVLTLHGRQFRDAALIVASPPCQEFSYMAMPWTLAKEKQRFIESNPDERKRLTALFDACFRIQREAIEAAGHHIPLVVENVRGACRWVGRSRWNYGSFHLWGDVPALMPMTKHLKIGDGNSYRAGAGPSPHFTNRAEHRKNNGGSWFNIAHNTTSGVGNNPDGRKNRGDWFSSGDDCSLQRRAGSKSPASKAASALIAKIPLQLSRHIAAVYRPVA